MNDFLRLRLPGTCTKSLSYAFEAARALPTEADGGDLDAIVKLNPGLVCHVYEGPGALVRGEHATSICSSFRKQADRLPRRMLSIIALVHVVRQQRFPCGENCLSDLRSLTNKFCEAEVGQGPGCSP